MARPPLLFFAQCRTSQVVFLFVLLLFTACGAGDPPREASFSAEPIPPASTEPAFASDYSRARYLIEAIPAQAVPQSFAVEAEALLTKTLTEHPELSLFIDYHRAETAFYRSDWAAVAVLSNAVASDTSAPSRLRVEALFLQAESLAAQNKTAEALEAFAVIGRILDENQKTLRARALWRRLELFDTLRDYQAASSTAGTLEEDYASTIFGYRAALYRKHLLDEFPTVMGYTPGSAELAFAQAEWFYDHTHYAEGALAFSALLDRSDLPRDLRVKTAYFAGRCYQREWHYAEARALMEPLLAEQGLYRTYALYQMGKIAMGQGRYEEAKDYFDRLLREAPSNFLADDALWNLADLERTVGENAQAQALYRRLYFDYPRSEFRALALLMLGRTRLESGDPDHALATFEQIFDRYENTAVAPSARYWMGIAREQKGDTASAIAEDLRLLASYSDNYYAFRARERIARLRPSYPAEEEFASRLSTARVSFTAGDTASALASVLWCYYGWPDSPRRGEAAALLHQINQVRGGWSELMAMPYDLEDPLLWDRLRAGAWVRGKDQHNRQLETARTLYTLGAYDEAAMVLQEIRAGAGHPLAYLYLKSALHALAGETYESMLEISRLMSLVRGPVDVALLPEPVARCLYPRFYWEEAVRAGESAGIDPYLLLAVAREESRFNPEVVSSAAAIGLCQFIPSTGRATALEAGLEDYENESLARPAVSLQLCAVYLASLRERWDGSLERAIASYNGGPGNVAVWEERSPGQEPVEFIESILFKESRNYVQRVLKSYENYRRLYEDR